MSRVIRPTLVLVLVLLRFGIGWEVLLGTNWFGFGFTTRNSTPTALKPKPTSKNSGEFQRAETIQWTNQDSKPTCSRHKARENGCERLTLGFHFLIGWRIKAARRLERGLTSAAETVFFLFHAPVFVFFFMKTKQGQNDLDFQCRILFAALSKCPRYDIGMNQYPLLLHQIAYCPILATCDIWVHTTGLVYASHHRNISLSMC